MAHKNTFNQTAHNLFYLEMIVKPALAKIRKDLPIRDLPKDDAELIVLVQHPEKQIEPSFLGFLQPVFERLRPEIQAVTNF